MTQVAEDGGSFPACPHAASPIINNAIARTICIVRPSVSKLSAVLSLRMKSLPNQDHRESVQLAVSKERVLDFESLRG
jgi:hypothetical protein